MFERSCVVCECERSNVMEIVETVCDRARRVQRVFRVESVGLKRVVAMRAECCGGNKERTKTMHRMVSRLNKS